MQLPMDEALFPVTETNQSQILLEEIKDFSLFNKKSVVKFSGEYAFSISAKVLIEACDYLKSLGGKSLQIVVQVSRLKLSVLQGQMFVETFIPITHITPFPEDYNFILDFTLVQKYTSVLSEDETIVALYVPEKCLFRVTSGESCLEFNTLKYSEFVDYHVKLQDLTYLGEINKEVLYEGLNHISKYVEKNELDLRFDLIELRDSMILGGTQLSAAFLKNSALSNVSFVIRQAYINSVIKVLNSFQDSILFLFKSNSFYLLRTSNMFFGWGKFEYSFPQINRFLTANSGEQSFSVNRDELLKAVSKLEIVSAKEKILYVKVKTSGISGKMHLSVKSDKGNLSKDAVLISSHTLGDVEQTFQLSLKDTIKTLDLLKSDITEFFEVPGKALAIVDQFNENTVISILAFMNQSKMNLSTQGSISKKTSLLSNFLDTKFLNKEK